MKGTTFAGLRSETGSEEDPASVSAWGELVLHPGCVYDAPRHILLSKNQTWFGRDPKGNLKDNAAFYFESRANILVMITNECIC